MIKVDAWQNCKPTLLLRRLSTGNDRARRRAATDCRLVVRSPLRDAGSLYPDRSIGIVTLSIASQPGVQCSLATHRQHSNPHSV